MKYGKSLRDSGYRKSGRLFKRDEKSNQEYLERNSDVTRS